MSPEKINRRLSTHRFDISERAFENLASIKQVLAEYQQNHPEVIGMTMYGSQTKGLDTDWSDFDAYIFVNDTTDHHKNPNDGPKRIEPKGHDPTYDEINSTIVPAFRALVEDQLHISPDKTKHIRARVLSHERINTEINDLETYCLAREAYFNGEQNTYLYVPETSLDLLFHLQLSNGLDQYRAYILNQLKDRGDLGDSMWNLIQMGTQIMEESGRMRAEDYLYPKTVDEAIRRYLPSLLQPSQTPKAGAKEIVSIPSETNETDEKQLRILRESLDGY
ncbi:hypothetical protein COY32_03330 [candidate division WWE3 bacterium CG_4_10_14_0_2_um_filter_41_14]|uniref:Uncharacterized protein n=1 Tax=candidate division WWE3 bacterium CG_4_10_14_0_2_um_filter_41_14 TaxID=1975072 RepID=A0A2M7TJ47_UNCKA|nr:MAG: hypothetical protein COY32_03330 [candidate division WWE3 bacterium CG_4_10_14_0_2_um_filter_41_14]